MGREAPARGLVRAEAGQVSVLALLGFLPFLVLVIVVLDIGVVINDRVGRQSAADAAALAAVQRQAVILNVISTSNVTMTYLLAEAAAEEAFLRTLERITIKYNTLVPQLEIECPTPAGRLDPRCPFLPFYRIEKVEFDALKTAAEFGLPQLCSFPGRGRRAASGTLFEVMSALSALEHSLSEVPATDAASATVISVANGQDGAVVATEDKTLPIARGRFGDLEDPTRNGSPDPVSDDLEGLQRGYQPIVGLEWNVGPASAPAELYRSLITTPVLAKVMPLVPHGKLYDLSHKEVFADWMTADRKSGPSDLPVPFVLAGVRRAGQIPEFRNGRQVACFVWGKRTSFFAEGLLGTGETIRLAYAQAEVYNGTSWDTFTEDWRVRLVPASLLERGTTPTHLESSDPSAPSIEPAFELPEEFMAWINAH
jgi:hypothetical protein